MTDEELQKAHDEHMAEKEKEVQASKFKCRENALAITKLEEALHWCGHRTAKREVQKVEGTHAVHA